jgi:cytochrome b subunit of formate dehydrogenase
LPLFQQGLAATFLMMPYILHLGLTWFIIVEKNISSYSQLLLIFWQLMRLIALWYGRTCMQKRAVRSLSHQSRGYRKKIPQHKWKWK